MRKAVKVGLGIVVGVVAADALIRRDESVVGRLVGVRRPSPKPATEDGDVSTRLNAGETEAPLHQGCREGVLTAARALHAEGRADFAPADVIDAMRASGTRYAESTIRTHVVTRMCGEAPDNHGTTYDDLERVGHGRYRLRERLQS